MRKSAILIVAILFPIITVFDANAAIIGVDFGPVDQPYPSNWNSISAEGTFNSLIDENGDTTGVNLSVVDDGGSAQTWNASIIPSTIPSHTNPLENISGNLYHFSGDAELELQFTGLEANAEYDIWVFGVRDGEPGLNQAVTIAGQSTPLIFDQIADSQQLVINDSLASSSQNLYAYAKKITSTAGGTLNINIVANESIDSPLYAVPGIAIEYRGQNQAIPTLSEWGIIIMSLILSGSALWMIRKRQISS